MGDIFSAFVGTMLEPIRDLLYRSIGRQFGYLVHCKKNIKDFADEVDKLSLTKARVQVKVDAAESNDEVLHDDVLEWRRKVQSMEDDKSRLLQSKDNLKCLDVCSRYRLGKEGKKKKPDVAQLIDVGNNFGDVGYQRLPTVTFQRTYSMNYESFQSREFVFEEIMKALKDDGTYKIGIHGMPGVGKTRMMEQVAQQAHRESLFDEVTQIVVSQNPILEDIQQKLAKSLNMKEPENASKKQICDRLRNGKRILIMVDDVWNNEIKLEEIGIPAADNRTKGCKILLTSRRKEVCLQMAEKEFEIGVLSEHEALDLFKKTVGDFTEHPELHSIAKEVCSECDCLPLAIVTVGKALPHQKKKMRAWNTAKMHAWNSALHQLKHSMGYNIPGVSKKVYSCIELSYQYLKLNDPMLEDLQPCFLHCCLFPEDAEICIDDLVKYAVGTRFLKGTNRESMEIARDRTRTLIDILKESNLLLNGRGENFVKMHDVIRDVAISIASKEKDAMFLVKAGVEKWPDEDEYKQCKAISLRLNDACVLPDDSECTEVCTLMLEFRNLSSEVPSSFFKGMEKLEVLQLRNMQISELPSSLKNLRMLCLYNCKLVKVAFLKEFKKLEILCIEDSDLRELAPEIGQLTRLRLLDVRYCYNLKIIPSGVISSLSQLEELYIPNEFDQWGVKDNASLNELNSLKHIISLQVFVPDVTLQLLRCIEPLFKSLNRFQISIRSKLSFWERSSSATRILKVVGFPLKKELNILMEKAEVLYLEDLRENVPKGLCGSVSFRELSLLDVENCKMIYLFSSAAARSLSQLQKLSVSICEIMEEIVRDDQEVMDGVIIFHHLKKIELKYLPKLRSFYASMKKSTIRECNTSTLVQALFNDKVSLPALEELTIEDLESLTAIWVDQSQPLEQVKEAEDSFGRLTNMIVHGCEKLVNVIPSCMLPRLQNLKQLQVGKCDSLFSEVVEVHGSVEKGSPTVEPTIDVLPRLQEMLLTDLPNLVMYMTLNRKEHFAGGICAYSNLTDLHLSKRDNLKNVFSPSTARYLVHLQKLEVCQCEKMEEIVAIEREELEEVGKEDLVHDEIIVFPQLKHLELKNLPNLKSFCCCTSGSKKREETVELNISQVEALFNHKVAFPALEELEIRELESLTAIWEGQSQSLLVKEAQVSFQSLRSMAVWECHKLVNVIASNVLPSLQKLEKLEVSECDLVEEIVAVERGQLEKEDIVHDEIIVFPQLKYLELNYLKNLKSFTLGSKESEETVDQIIPRVEALFNHKVAFPALEELEISELESLTAIWEGQSQSLQVKEAQNSFQSLRSMKVWNCDKLVNVIASNVLPSLQKLEKLFVYRCYSVEGIVEVERGQLGEEDVVHDEIVVFSQLKYLKLYFLPNLTSFTHESKEEGETVDQIISRVEALFNHKVAFPALEKLKIRELESLTAIWEGQSQSLQVKEAQISFQSLRSMRVCECHKLVNVIASNVLPSLQKLEKLEVSECDSVEEIVAVERGQLEKEDIVHDEIIVFPQLKYLKLKDLKNLKSFTLGSKEYEETVDQIIPRVEALFNHKVAFPVLEELDIGRLESLTAIWEGQSQSLIVKEAQVSFQSLRSMDVWNCDKLVNVIASNVLPSLQKLEKLKASKCDSLKEIFALERGQLGEKDGVHDEIIVFPQLKYLELEELPRVETLFNHKVAFPVLEELDIGRLESLTAIWEGQSQSLIVKEAQVSFQSLRSMDVWNCDKLVNVIASNVLPSLQKLEILKVSKCDSVKEIFAVERGQLGEKDGVHDEIIVFPQLKYLELEELPRVETLFNHKVSFPALKKLKITKLQSLAVIWDNQLFLDLRAQVSQLRFVIVQGCEKLVNVIPPNAFPTGLMVFHSLKYLILSKCNSLRYVFSFSIARGLTQLRGLGVVGCSVMEEIVRSEGEGEEDYMDEIVFSQLKYLCLEGLPNLTCFCGTNNAFKFPSLKWVGLGKCPQLQTFTTGCLSTPNKLTIDYEVGQCNDVIDLNDYVQQFVRREKGLAVDESEDDDEDYDFGDDDDDYDYDDDLDGFMLRMVRMVRRMMYGRRRRNKSW